MKEFEQEYRAEIAKVWPNDERMVEYCCKKASAIIKLSTGQLMEFEKPSIETQFCFGYSDDMDGSDRKDALDMAKHACSNEEYFKSHNLHDIKRIIERYEKEDEFDDPYLTHRYPDYNTNIVTVVWLSEWDAKDKAWQFHNDLTPLSDTDRKTILAAYKEELKKLEKRIDTYLKRYGLSKVRSWTYWRDE